MLDFPVLAIHGCVQDNAHGIHALEKWLVYIDCLKCI